MRPTRTKVAALRDFLDELGIPGLAFAKGQAPKPELFNRLLRRAEATPVAPLVNDLVLRCQAQAAYSPDNIGHFGLGLRRYAHFTSPIRRYADLLVHRALIAGANAAGSDFGAGALPPDIDHARMAAVGEHISATERRAAAAERAAIERYRAILVADAIGGLFAARISGVADFGLFVTLAESGATGLVPISTLPGDYYDRQRKAAAAGRPALWPRLSAGRCGDRAACRGRCDRRPAAVSDRGRENGRAPRSRRPARLIAGPAAI